MAEGQGNDPTRPGFAIGATLKEARQRLGMGVKEAEERTKIRARYLRALEAEDWEALPGPAYARGFLRTYASLLGLDGAMLADEYRRRYESNSQLGSSLGAETVRPGRGRASGGPSRGVVAGIVAAVVVLLLVVLGLLSGGGDEQEQPAPGNVVREKRGQKAGGQSSSGKPPKVELTVSPASPMTVCLVAGKKPLIDSQILAAGVRERFDGERLYRLDLPDPGEVTIAIGRESQKLVSSGGQSFEISARGVREVNYEGPDCP